MAEIRVPVVEKKDALDRIIQGLQIAGGILNIPVAISELVSKKEQRDIARAGETRAAEAADRSQKGIFTASEVIGSGLVESPEGTAGAQPAKLLLPGGEIKQTFLLPKGMTPATVKLEVGKQEDDLRKEIAGHVTSQITQELYTQTRKLDAALALGTGRGDLAAIKTLEKVLDPKSIVREGEVDLQRAAGSAETRFRNTIAGWTSGQMLTPQQRSEIRALIGQLWKIQAASQRELNAQFAPIVQDRGLNPDFVFPIFARAAEQESAKPPSRGVSPDTATPSARGAVRSRERIIGF